MRAASVCSGIGGAERAAPWASWAWNAEIARFPSAVLAHRFPDVPNLGDLTGWGDWPDERIDLLCGGTPCQSFSVAGNRRGVDDPRGRLALEFTGLAAALRPRIVMWENVPGVLSCRGGWDFAAIIGSLAKAGYGLAWREFDVRRVCSASFPRALPQLRRRIHLIGCAGGDRRRAAQILSVPEGGAGPPPPPPEGGQPAARAGGGAGGDRAATSFYRRGERKVSRCLNTKGQRLDGKTDTFIGEPDGVRRLTPTECERLMGFPDGWTALPQFRRRDGTFPDAPRYAALGNSWALNVTQWIMDRIRAEA